MRNSSGKIEVLDAVRAFSALSVCLFHFVCTTREFIDNKFILQIFANGKFGVQCFFVISGFIIPWSMYRSNYKLKNGLVFLAKRFIRLEPPYLISILTALVMLWVRNSFYDDQGVVSAEISVKQVLYHIGYMIPFQETYNWLNSVYWTLAIEFQYYIFIAFVFGLVIHNSIVVRIGFYFFCLACTFLGSDQFLPFWLPFFLLGILLFLFKTAKISIYEYGAVMFIAAILLLFRYPYMMVVFSFIPILCVLFFENVNVFVLGSLGKFTYSLYLFHSIVGAPFVNVMSHKASEPLHKFAIILAGIGISLVFSWVIYRIVERPSQKLSSSLKYPVSG